MSRVGFYHRMALLFLIFTVFILANAPAAQAFSFSEFFKDTKNKIQGILSTPKELSVTSQISHAPNGDTNNDGKIDAGEIITFNYTINNPTDNSYKFLTLKTNVPNESINYIHDVNGATGIKETDKTVDIPNLRILPHETTIISFSARINYYSQEDAAIWTEPELLTMDKKSLIKANKEEIKATKMNTKNIPSNIKIFNKPKTNNK